jgi:cellulose synthase/poly-beta-1,6-N-acetylglucosamine synthase-like glycosyltransferase
LNAAIRAARGDIIIRMDAHTEYAPDYIRRCVETLRRTGADNVGGPARTKVETLLERAVAAAYHSSFSVGGARFHDIGYEGWVDTVTYGCWRRETFERFGYFDEELVRNQDDEHNLRIVRGGGRIWQNPQIKSWYRPRGSFSALFRQYLQYGYWKVRVIQKHKLPASWRHLVPGAFVLTLLSLFLLSTFSFLLFALSRLSAFRFHPSALACCDFSFQVSAFSLFSVLTLYAFLVSVASIATAAKSEWKLLPVLPIVFGCYHFGYGCGFLCGIWDFVIRRRRPRASLERLAR